MKNFEDQAAAWDAAVAGVGVPADATDNSLDVVIGLLERQLDRAITAIKSNDDKAALVIPAIGAIAAISGSNVRSDIASQGALAILGGTAAGGGVAAIIASIVALRPQSLSNGVVAVQAVRGSLAPSLVGKVNYMKSLGFAVSSAERLVVAKAFWVNWAFRIGAIGVVALTLFTAFGGFAASTGGK